MTKKTETLLQFAALAIVGYLWTLPEAIALALLTFIGFPYGVPVLAKYIERWVEKEFPENGAEQSDG